MTKDVWISVRGMQFEGAEDAEKIEVIQKGQFYKRNGAGYLIYEEPVEGSSQIIKNMIKFRDNEVSVSKKGAINTSLSFLKNEKSLTNYDTPYGSLMIGIETRQIEIEESDGKLTLHIDYALDVNYQFLTNCRIMVEAREV